MTEHEERETKLSATPGLALPDLEGIADGVRVEDSGIELLEATYWDTERLDLVHRGYGLRHRFRRDRPDKPGIWTLKTPGRRDGDAFVRGEYEVEADAAAPPGELLGRLPQDVDRGALAPAVVLHTERRVFELCETEGDGAVEVVDDRVEVHDRDGEVVERFRELEVEVKGGDTSLAEAVVTRLRQAGAGEPESSSKYLRGLRALGHDVESAPL